MKTVLRVALPLLLAAFAVYLLQPVLNLSFVSTWMLAFVLIGLTLAFFSWTSGGKDSAGRVALALIFTVAAPAAALVLAMFFSSAMVHADRYRDQLGVEKDASFNVALPPIDIRQAPLVSEDMARRSAEKRLSEISGLGSQVTIGPLEKQIVDGRLLWVGFLEHSGFFRWFDRKTTPGYVTVSATDATDVKLVTELNGKKLALRYLESAFWGDELTRHVYFSGHATLAMSEIIPEIDDSGRPYAVIPMHEKSIGMGGDEVREVLVVDVQTGEIAEYPLDKVPAWVDRVQPKSFIQEQIDNRGEYVHGWLNPSKADQWMTSDEPDVVFGANGRAYIYQGIRSLGNPNAIIGFYLIDSRTKAARKFDLSGTTEDGAKKAAEGVLPEKRYTATNPLPFSVDGRPTFVMALRDASGIPRAYAMVNIETYQIVAVSDTLQDTLRKYQSLLSRDRTHANVDSQVSQKVLAGRVARIGRVDHGGNTVFYLTLDTDKAHLFIADNNVSEKLAVAEKGDSVVIAFEAGDAQTASITQFEDRSILGDVPQAPVAAPAQASPVAPATASGASGVIGGAGLAATPPQS